MKIILSFFSVLYFFNSCFSQSVQKDSVSNLQLNNAIAAYNHFSALNAPVYNGREYLFYTFKMEGDPYFINGDFSKGWVHYSGRKYDSLPMIYDIARNELVVWTADKRAMVVLDNDFVDSFELLGHTFIRLEEDHQQNLYNSGFYDVLYNGGVQFLARRIKTMDAPIKGNLIVRVFYPQDRYYIHKEGLYYLINKRKDVYRLFDDKIHDVKRLMRKEHVRIRRKNFEEATQKVTQIYDQLTH